MPDYSSLHRGLQNYWSMDNGSRPYTQWDRMRMIDLNYSGSVPVGGATTTGKIGKGLVSEATGGGGTTPAGPTFPYVSDPDSVTIISWIYFSDLTATRYAISSGYNAVFGAHYLYYNLATGLFTFRTRDRDTGLDLSVTCPDAATIGWHLLIAKWDLEGKQIGIKVDNGLTTWSHNNSISSYSPGKLFKVGVDCEGIIDDTAYWTRLLTDEEEGWLWNDGNGLGFDDFGVVAEDTTCTETPCCEEDPYTYAASQATASGSSTGSDCAVVPNVTIEPPQSSFVSFPTFILLSADISGSVIRYTTDDTEPNENSTIYTIPFEVFGPTAIVKAKAWYGECVGPMVSAVYRRAEQELTFKNICASAALRAGKWGEFIAPFSVSVNYEWELSGTLIDPLHVVAFETFETNSAGVWNTGQAWSTREYIDPPNSKSDFHVYPLVLDEGGQLMNTYTEDLCTDIGDFAAVAHTISMYGGVQVDIPGVTYFRLRMFLDTGDVVERIIASDVCTPPPCEQFPPNPALTPSCLAITVSFTTTSGRPYEVWRWASSGGSAIRVFAGSLTNVGATTFVDSSCVVGVTYCYSVRVQYAGCPEFTSSDAVCAQLVSGPYLNVSADTTYISGTSGTVTFTVQSSHLDIDGLCLSDDVAYSFTDGAGGGSGTVNGNVIATLAVLVTRPAAPGPYQAVFNFSACNGCGTATQQITITFIPPLDCSTCGTPAIATVDTAALQTACQATVWSDNPGLACYAPAGPISISQWSGQLVFSSGCVWVQAGSFYLAEVVVPPIYVRVRLGVVYAYVNCDPAGPYWELTIGVDNGTYEMIAWIGRKTDGTTPIGTYQYVSGCLASLTTLNVT